jgi:hypothetical protein
MKGPAVIAGPFLLVSIFKHMSILYFSIKLILNLCYIISVKCFTL